MNSVQLLDLLIDIMSLAPNLADYLSQYPSTFDVMIDVSFFIPPKSEADFETEIQHIIRYAVSNDNYLHNIRKFNREQKFKIGVLVLKNLMTTLDASIAFTALARVCIQHTTYILEKEMREKHNIPYRKNDENSICVIGMGSVGAYEMNADSDLDLLMVYNPDDAFCNLVDAPSYYAKLGKRILTALTISTSEGSLYAVDMRLRPSGNSGPLVIHYERFVDYQTAHAHTWEHCALTRLYPICGNELLQKKIMAQTKTIIAMPHERKIMRDDIDAMRLKLLVSRPAVNIWDIKLSKGGLFDIGFIAQYLILLHSNTISGTFSNRTRENFVILHKHNLLSSTDFNMIVHAFDMYHSLLHIFAIAKLDIQTINSETVSRKITQRICDIMGIADFSQATDYLSDTYQKISAIYQSVFAVH
jgi:glutamate-ammonia-ligase adenylyltransferase